MDVGEPAVELNIPDAEAMESLGARLAGRVETGSIIYLSGDLGAGKTTLVRGYLRGLGHTGKVKSPTYTLIEPYSLAECRLNHLDLYRLADPEELEFLGIRDLFDADTVTLIEWPERGAGSLPPADLRIDIAHQDAGRALRLTAESRRGARALRQLAEIGN